MAKHQTEKRKPGRPRQHEVKRKHLGVRLAADVASALDAYCEAQTIKPSPPAVALHAITTFLKNEGYLDDAK